MCHNKVMTDEELLKITSSIEEKLGDNSAIIADDLGLLLTGNANSQKLLQDKDAEIAQLKSTNEKLVIANGNLLKQVPIEHKVEKSVTNRHEENSESSINLSDAFDKSGRFTR